ncbi:hypothetical protein [Niveispirillum cyanobacteriorum]|uniref:Uncharacterized protein n=1 Tax=Niveispirillum cyanobacteriorum TaxID=1612173 RepID=A0A2K9NLI0_9PROT|nr:hypothetical protein [Niveispirillum cyanobacteriorum]AUN33911.1 hypothetical protein C0V82_26235 [Niveispirillum cyanobacteriorum]GGE85964.1 hypothetical protein GCM10011317_48910 [Niveispirillum cyanobacteriorum]
MIDQNGQPVTKPSLKTYLATYNAGIRGSKEFGALPRALITICDNLALGKTTYVKCVEGQVQLSRRKDGSIAGNGL